MCNGAESIPSVSAFASNVLILCCLPLQKYTNIGKYANLFA
jgi:hypothetical protein